MTSKPAKATTPEFDVLDFSTDEKSVEGSYMPFKHPKYGEPVTHQADGDDAPRELHLVLMGASAPEAQRVFRQLQNRVKRRGEYYVPSNDDLEADRIADSKGIAKLVISGLMFSGGQWVELDKKNAGDFLYKIDPLRNQAVAHILDAGNYIAS